MARSQVQYLSDIDEAMAAAREFADNRNLEDFRKDRQLRYAIKRALEIIGEATSNLSDEIKDRDSWHQMKGLRNIVALAYHRVDPARVWRVVDHDLPKAHEKIQDLLKEVRDEET